MFSWFKNLFAPRGDEQIIDYFQLEGLVRNQVPFLLLDLRSQKPVEVPKPLASLMKDAESVLPKDLETYLREKQVSEIQPIVLLCKKGSESRKAAKALVKKSWLNVYAVDGGFDQLEKELEPPPG